MTANNPFVDAKRIENESAFYQLFQEFDQVKASLELFAKSLVGKINANNFKGFEPGRLLISGWDSHVRKFNLSSATVPTWNHERDPQSDDYYVPVDQDGRTKYESVVFPVWLPYYMGWPQ